MTSRQLSLSAAVLIFALSVTSVSALPITVTLDPGADGTSFEFKEFFFSELAGTQFNGQTISLDILFSGFLVAPAFTVELFLNQDGGIGTIPNQGLSLSGYLLDEAGLSVSPQTNVTASGWMPGQVWPGWPFVLNGEPFLPPTTIHALELEGMRQTRHDANLGNFIDIDPLLFSGLHYDITFPDTTNILIGSRLTISNRNAPFPILISPDPIPEQFSVHVPDFADTRLLLLCGFLALIVFRAKVAM